MIRLNTLNNANSFTERGAGWEIMRNFAAMIRAFIILILLTTRLLPASSQDVGDPTFVPMVKLSKTVVDGDTIQYMEMQDV